MRVKTRGLGPQTPRISEHNKQKRARYVRFTPLDSDLVMRAWMALLLVTVGDTKRKARDLAVGLLTGVARAIASFKAAVRTRADKESELDKARADHEQAVQRYQQWREKASTTVKSQPAGGSAALTLLVLGTILVGEFIYTNAALAVLALGNLAFLLSAGITAGFWLAALKLALLLDALTQDRPELRRRVQLAMALLAAVAGFVLVWELGELRVAYIEQLNRQNLTTGQIGVPHGAVQALLGVGVALFALLVVVEFRVAGQRPALSPEEWGPRLSLAWERHARAWEPRRTARRLRVAERAFASSARPVDAATSGLYALLPQLRSLPGLLADLMEEQGHLKDADALRFAGYVYMGEWPVWKRFTNWLTGKPAEVDHRPLAALEPLDVGAMFPDIKQAAQAFVDEIERLLGITPTQAEPQPRRLHVVVTNPDDDDHDDDNEEQEM